MVYSNALRARIDDGAVAKVLEESLASALKPSFRDRDPEAEVMAQHRGGELRRPPRRELGIVRGTANFLRLGLAGGTAGAATGGGFGGVHGALIGAPVGAASGAIGSIPLTAHAVRQRNLNVRQAYERGVRSTGQYVHVALHPEITKAAKHAARDVLGGTTQEKAAIKQLTRQFGHDPARLVAAMDRYAAMKELWSDRESAKLERSMGGKPMMFTRPMSPEEKAEHKIFASGSSGDVEGLLKRKGLL